jgi:diketogulonate reductase-like aldo/keto reductase
MHWPQAYMPAPEDDDPTQAVIGGSGQVVRDHESPTIEETWAAMEALLETGRYSWFERARAAN